MMIVVYQGETKYYYHFDGLGSVVALSNVNHQIVESYSYDVFGEPNRISCASNPYMFAGRAYDNETGNYYYRARYYSPYLGRFVRPDPIRYRAGLNLYTYCGSNPINWVDPYGLWPARVHRRMINNAYPTLPQPYRDAMAQGSDEVDQDQSPEGAFKHEMRDGVKDQSAEEAEKKMKDYINDNLINLKS